MLYITILALLINFTFTDLDLHTKLKFSLLLNPQRTTLSVRDLWVGPHFKEVKTSGLKVGMGRHSFFIDNRWKAKQRFSLSCNF